MFQAVRDEFLGKLRASRRSALLMDYNGTLAPFSEQRDHALPYPEIPEVLSEIMKATTTRVVIVSGLPAADVGRLLGMNPYPEIWGAHGLDRLHPDGTSKTGRVDRRSVKAIQDALTWAGAQGLEQNVERKPGGIALHWRGLAEAESDKMYQSAMQAFLPLTRVSRLSLSQFDGGLELRVRNSNKGHLVDEIAREMDGAPIAYLGDDRTDEDAFRALQGRGLSGLVRPELRPTAANLWLRPPEELLEFLGDWLKASRGKALARSGA